MCGRFTMASPVEIVAATFGVAPGLALAPRYNIAPTQQVPIVRLTGAGRELTSARWGLIPSWAKEAAIGDRLINARSETLAEKPAFRAALKARRCLVVADGFYEWKKTPGGKQPWYFSLADGRPFGFAGLWEAWGGVEPALVSCTIATTSPNELVADVHDRMPVILDPGAADRWLDPSARGAAELSALLGPFPPHLMRSWPVSRLVNNPGADDPRCRQPLAG